MVSMVRPCSAVCATTNWNHVVYNNNNNNNSSSTTRHGGDHDCILHSPSSSSSSTTTRISVRWFGQKRKVSKFHRRKNLEREAKRLEKLGRVRRKEERKQAEAQYQQILSDLLAERNIVTFHQRKQQRQQQGKENIFHHSMEDKWAKKSWRLALVLHWISHPGMTTAPKEDGQERMDKFLRPRSFQEMVEEWADQTEKTTGVVPTRRQRRKRRAQLERQRLLEHMEYVKEALEERGVAVDLNDQVGEWQTQLKESVLLEAGIVPPPKRIENEDDDNDGDGGADSGEDDDDDDDEEEGNDDEKVSRS